MKNKMARTLCLEATLDKGRLKISIHKPDDVIWSYEDIPAPMDRIETRCRKMIETLNRATGEGSAGGSNVLTRLKAVGRMLSDELLTPDIKEDLRKTGAHYLILKLDDHLVHIPWELLCVGEEFLCQRFNMGRLVRTRQKIVQSSHRDLTRPLKMWILANPGGDLASAGLEGLEICRCMDRMNQKETVVDASLDSDVTHDEIRENIRNYDFVHFAGHADYNSQNPGESGWKLPGGNLTARDIYKMAGGSAMPAFVFSNACQSARTKAWKWKKDVKDDSFGLANAFMLAGVRHYVGTFWEITDEPGNRFAIEFYEHLLSGITVGEAVRLSRAALIQEYGPDFIGWASYLLYGDPTSGYFDQKEKAKEPEEPELATSPNPAKDHTRGKWFGSSENTAKSTKKRNWLAPCLAILGFFFLVITSYYIYKPDSSRPPVDSETLKILQAQASKKRERIDQLFKELELIAASPEALAYDEAPPDDWTSGHLTLAMDFDSQRCFLHRGKEKLIASVIETQILEHTRVTLLERISLDIILEELKRANSKLVAPKNRLLPDLLTAKLILFLEVDLSDAQPFVLMHLADTTKGSVVDVLIEPLETAQPVLAQKKKLSENLLKKLKSLYPLRGRISEITGKEIRLNIGSEAGVTIGQRFKVADKDLTLEVVSIQLDTSTARAEKGELILEKGWRVEAI